MSESKTLIAAFCCQRYVGILLAATENVYLALMAKGLPCLRGREVSVFTISCK